MRCMIFFSIDVLPSYAALPVCLRALKPSADYLAKPPRIQSNDENHSESQQHCDGAIVA
ncbi:hypothetical protein KSC_106380 [Ktedonobacter sp. SOSP1-52]|nr:hypothetical protein KSC_106380 [Ktedonobacter sp. SOSP1-52]